MYRPIRAMRRPVLAVTVATIALTAALPATAAPATAPALKLTGTADHVETMRYGRGGIYLELGMYVAALRGDWRIDAGRDGYEQPIHAEQVVAGAPDVPIDPALLDGWLGLDGFFDLDVYLPDGTEPIRHRSLTFCPNGYDQQRVNDEGPREPTFPSDCSSFMFLLGTVWGIDQGWSTRVPTWGDRPIRLADGSYRVRLSIAPVYTELFQIADADAERWVDVEVIPGDGCFEGCPIDRRGTFARRGRLTAAPDIIPTADVVSDLVALPAWSITVDHVRNRDVLSFAANVWNRGPSPLVVEGFRRDGEEVMDAFQYFFDGDDIVGRAPVGTFEFDHHDDHAHWHFTQFARYSLLDGDRTETVRSRKQAFCLAPTDPIDLLVPNAAWRFEDLGFSRCGSPDSLWIRETLPVGWGDTYYQSLFGQGFNITNLPNGTYWIEVAANPEGVLFDASRDNDVRLRRVILGGEPGARTVRVPPWRGIDTESGWGYG